MNRPAALDLGIGFWIEGRAVWLGEVIRRELAESSIVQFVIVPIGVQDPREALAAA